MHDYTVKADVDTMLRANDKAGIRSAIGVGTTDAPTFLAQTLTGQSLTGTQATSLVDLATTWDTTGTPTGIKLDVTDTASNAASLLMDLQVDGLSKFKVAKGGEFSFRSGSNFASISADGVGKILLNSLTSAGARVVGDLQIGSNDVALVRDSAPGILAQRNGTNAQAFRVYNTYPGTTANEWFEIDWKTSANVAKIGTAHNGTGGDRELYLTAGSNIRLFSTTGGSVIVRNSANTTSIFEVSATSVNLRLPMLFSADNTYDIGAATTNRPKDIYAGNNIQASATGYLGWYGRALLSSPADGIIRLVNNAGGSFTRLELGAANLGISRGTGTPEGTVTALVGSLYIRTDGGASTTLYVKESSPTPSTGWVAK